MKFNSTPLLFIILLSASLKVSAQTDRATPQRLSFERYVTVWVKSAGGYIDEQRKIDTNKQLASLKKKDVCLFIPPNPDIITPKGIKYIAAYFINNTKDSISIERADATLSGIQTEIKVGDHWKLLQINMGSSCGNSYYSMKLAPGKYISLQIENRIKGDVKVKYRLIAYADKKKIVSNEAEIYVSDDMLKLAGTPIKPLSM